MPQRSCAAVVLSRADPYPVGGSRYRPDTRARFPDQPGLTGPLRIGDYARIEEAAVVGDECVIEPEAYLPAGVKVPPFKTIKATAPHGSASPTAQRRTSSRR